MAEATETYTIRRRPGWEFRGEIKVEIACDPTASAWVKLGLAVKAALKARANLSRANLSGADLSGADLSRANLNGADLSEANLCGADLSGADLSGEQLRIFKADMWLTLTEARDQNEIRFLIAALRAGAVDGSTYGDGKSCACLVGTLARYNGEEGRGRDHGSSRPAERWFMMIKPGDTPGRLGDDGKETAGGFAARMALAWALGWCAAVGVDPELPAGVDVPALEAPQ